MVYIRKEAKIKNVSYRNIMGKVLRFRARKSILCNFCMRIKKGGIGKPKVMYSLALGRFSTLHLTQYNSGWWKHVYEEKMVVKGIERTYVEEECHLCPDCSPHPSS